MPYPRPAYAWYVVGVLTLAYVSSFIDRQILGLLVVPIRRDLDIGDTSMSLLMGLSFALFYTVLGLPIGRLADSRSRRGIIAVGIAVWSVMTMLCGVARTYGQLLVARVGVGVGEAALSPPAYSLTSDYFPPERLATAISVYSLGIGGAVIGIVSGTGTWSWPIVGEIRPWQSVFFVVGAPGLLIALLVLTIREPVRRGAGGSARTIPLGEVLAYMRRNARTFVSHNLGYALFAMVNYGTAAWLPTFFIRTHGWSAARAGVVLGLLTSTVGVLGIITGGRVADRMLARGHSDAKMRVGIIAGGALLVCAWGYTLAPSAELAIAALVPFNFFAAFPFGASAAGVQELVPNRMRAQASAVYLFVVNLVGLGLGPTVVALVTEHVLGDDAAVGASLRFVSTLGYLASAALLLSGLASYRRSVRFRAQWASGAAA